MRLQWRRKGRARWASPLRWGRVHHCGRPRSEPHRRLGRLDVVHPRQRFGWAGDNLHRVQLPAGGRRHVPKCWWDRRTKHCAVVWRGMEPCRHRHERRRHRPRFNCTVYVCGRPVYECRRYCRKLHRQVEWHGVVNRGLWNERLRLHCAGQRERPLCSRSVYYSRRCRCECDRQMGRLNVVSPFVWTDWRQRGRPGRFQQCSVRQWVLSNRWWRDRAVRRQVGRGRVVCARLGGCCSGLQAGCVQWCPLRRRPAHSWSERQHCKMGRVDMDWPGSWHG